MKEMRTNSCRNCGNELQIVENCVYCDQALHYQCQNCTKFVDDPIHLHGISVVT